MPTDDQPPMFTIGEAVTRLQAEFADTSHSSLHFLERSGFLTSHRSAGGHRLYRQADIDRIRQIKRWQQDRLSLAEIRIRLDRQADLVQGEDLADLFLEHAGAGRRGEALSVVLDAMDVGCPARFLFDDVLVPVLVEIGRRWHGGELLVAQEKEITEIIREAITDITLRQSPTVPAEPTVVAGSITGELHELGVRMITGLLRIDGYDMHFLGANVAATFFEEAVRLHRPAAVLLSARDPGNLPALVETLTILRVMPESIGSPQILVGGAVAQTHGAVIRAHGAIAMEQHRIGDAVDRIRQLMTPGDKAHVTQT